MILFFQQWYGELLKLFARRRTYIGFGAFVALEVLLLLLIKYILEYVQIGKISRLLVLMYVNIYRTMSLPKFQVYLEVVD